MFCRGHCVDWLSLQVFVENVSRFVEVRSNMRANFFDDIGAVVIDSRVELLCCTSYILFVAFGAGGEVLCSLRYK